MTEKSPHRLRLKLPNGAEIEVEGSPEFIAGERREFASMQAARPASRAPGEPPEQPLEPAWDIVTEIQGGNIQLRAKLGGDKTARDACLILIAAAKTLLRTPKPTAAQLARWLRTSGYPISRVDRALQGSIAAGDILASGSRRARRYELSGPGLAKAFRLAHQLRAVVGPPQ